MPRDVVLQSIADEVLMNPLRQVLRGEGGEGAGERIKGLCGAKPPHKPCWTNAVGWVLVEWSGTVGTCAGERSRWSARHVH